MARRLPVRRQRTVVPKALRMLARRSADPGSESAAALVEMILVLPLLLGLILGALALSMAEIAQAVVIGAARDAGRLASIECGQGNPAWWSDAEASAHQALAGLYVTASPTPDPVRYGQWAFSASCPVQGTPGILVTVAIVYEEVDLFPPATTLLDPQSPAMSTAFRLQSVAEFPAE